MLTALDLAVARVADAYRNGYSQIELVHGAADVTEPREDGRGRIKWELRRLLDQGGFDPYCVAGEAWPKSASLLLRLRPNPRPRPESWRPAPRPSHRS